MSMDPSVTREWGPEGEGGMPAEEAYEPTYSYDDIFPALPETQTSENQAPQLGQWNQKMKVQTSIVTQVFRVPVEERRFREFNRFGEQEEQAKICADIMTRTGAHIEISSAKDLSLTILVTGKEDAVFKAKRMIVAELQTQACETISIPKAHHRVILGKSGKKLQELELATATKIKIPRQDENSDVICITGTKEGIDKALHEIKVVSDEQAKLAFERISIPKVYHPFIAGPFNKHLEELINETGARINIPPVLVMNDDITVSGEKDAVQKAKQKIVAVYEEKKKKCQTVSVEVKKQQHKYVFGPRGHNISEILEQTGVSVEIPPTNTDSETITLRGDQDKLGAALTLLYAKASSVKEIEVSIPVWLHKFIIGKSGANIKNMTQNFPKVHIEFTDKKDAISLKGPPEEVEELRKKLEESAESIMKIVTYKEQKFEAKFFDPMVRLVTRLKREHGVVMNCILRDNDKFGLIRIEGKPESVESAKIELTEAIHKLENEVVKEVKIDQKVHRHIIGAKGEKVKEIRSKFNNVSINIPEPSIKSDVIQIRGEKPDVEQCAQYLIKYGKELVANSYKVEVPINKTVHKFIIGKAGANIKKIRDETNTRIDLPAEGSESNRIIITGKKENVEAAREKILAIESEMVNIVQEDIIIPAKMHNALIGAKGSLIHSISEECGGVNIRFPQENDGSDKITIRGLKDDVKKAKKQLTELAGEMQLASYSETVKAKPEHHRFLIGRSGSNIKKVRDKTGTRIVFPAPGDGSNDTITITGKKEAVIEAKKELLSMIEDLDKVVESEMQVETQYHKHFVARKGEVLRVIAEEYGGVSVSFPRNGENSERVVLKGSKDCVDAAKNRILEIVADLASRITVDCIIPQQYHRVIMGPQGRKVQRIQNEFDVQIKFPDRNSREEPVENGYENNGDLEDGEVTPEKPKKCDIVVITGKDENCNLAKDALLACVPITIEMEVPFDLHRFIIGRKGADVRDMMNRYDVNITVPPADSQSNVIKLSGPPANVEEGKQALIERVQKLEDERRDRELRNFQLSVDVDQKYHSKLIGPKGSVITKIRLDHGVQVQFPDNNSDQNIIIITGYEDNTYSAKEDIMRIVDELADLKTEDIKIDHRIHSRIIGSKGRNIRRIMDDFDVTIRFPQKLGGDTDPDIVSITGLEENIEDAKDHLLNLEEEFIQDIQDTEYLRQPNQYQEGASNYPKDDKKGFVVKGGPWEQQAPDMSNTQDFPSFGSGDVPKPVAWGPRR